MAWLPQGLEAAAGGVEDGVEQRRHNGNHHDSAMPFGGSSASPAATLDLEIAQRQVCRRVDEVLPPGDAGRAAKKALRRS